MANDTEPFYRSFNQTFEDVTFDFNFKREAPHKQLRESTTFVNGNATSVPVGTKPIGIATRSPYHANSSVDATYFDFTTSHNNTQRNHFAARTVINSSWRPKVSDTPASDVMANQDLASKTHWGRMNTIGDATHIVVKNYNNPDSPFEMINKLSNYSPSASTAISNVGNKVRYCWIVSKEIRQAFKARRTNASQLPSPHFFFRVPANFDLRDKLKCVMIPAGASIIIKKEPKDCIVISNTFQGHGGHTQNSIGINGRSYRRNFDSNCDAEVFLEK